MSSALTPIVPPCRGISLEGTADKRRGPRMVDLAEAAQVLHRSSQLVQISPITIQRHLSEGLLRPDVRARLAEASEQQQRQTNAAAAAESGAVEPASLLPMTAADAAAAAANRALQNPAAA